MGAVKLAFVWRQEINRTAILTLNWVATEDLLDSVIEIQCRECLMHDNAGKHSKGHQKGVVFYTLRYLILFGMSFVMVSPFGVGLIADEPTIEGTIEGTAHPNPPELARVTDSQWNRIDTSIDKAISFLATQQRADGSFPTYISAKPGVTGLCVMALLARGHLPGDTEYGRVINRGIDFVLSTQRSDGLFTEVSVNDAVAPWHSGSHVCLYNHGICGTMLGEVYGCTDAPRANRIAAAIRRGLLFTRSRQVDRMPRAGEDERGGWRYYGLHFDGSHSDLSVTSWQLMFLRSAENSGFQVPKEFPDEAIAYVKRCYKPATGAFRYSMRNMRETRAMTGAGITCLFLAGHQDPKMEMRSAQWLASHPFDRVDDGYKDEDRFFYGAYYCSLASLQIGGECWAKVYPPLANTLLEYQRDDGSWPAEKNDAMFGNSYSTAMALLALAPPYQLLPIYQR